MSKDKVIVGMSGGVDSSIIAAEKLKKVNSDVAIEVMVKDLNHMNTEKIMSGVV